MARNNNTHPINVAAQGGLLKSYFPESDVAVRPSHLIWKHTITPSPLSPEYEIKIDYTIGRNPNIYVVSPTLLKYKGKSSLPHVYDSDKQWLCLYYKLDREWRNNMMIADTIVPWASEWLFFYEIWLGTGDWKGGGVHIGSASEKQKTNNNG